MKPYEFTFGPQPLPGGGTRFRLWAPGQDSVTLEVAGAEPLAMTPRGDGWFELDTGHGPGTRYRYGVDGMSVPDPASRLQDLDIHDVSVVAAPDAFAWKHAAWPGRPWHETVLYELHVGLCDGYAGVAARLPELARLGVTAIELMPIGDFPGPRNWGYDGVLPYAPDTAYGTPDELKAMIDTAHGLGIMVFLDVVYNHFGPEGNYLHHYASDFFREDIRTAWGPALDFRRAEVRRFFAENALYWLREFRFDGLRLDAVHAIHAPDWLAEMAHFVRSHCEPDRHVHLVLENDDNSARLLGQGFDAQWNDDAHHVLHVLLTGETDGYYQDYAQQPEERLARCLAEGFIYQGEPSVHRGARARGEPSAHLPPTAFVLFLQNHDQIGNRAFGERLSTLLNAPPPNEQPNPLAAAVALQLLCPHIPLLFMGEEFASTTPFLYFTSHPEKLAQAVREGRRQEFAGFTDFSRGGARRALPDPNARSTFAGSTPVPPAATDARANLWNAYYGHLLDIRRQRLVPHLPATRALLAQAIGPGAVIARWRLGTAGILTLALNLGPQAVTLAAPLDGELLFASYRPTPSPEVARDVLMAGTLLATLAPPGHEHG